MVLQLSLRAEVPEIPTRPKKQMTLVANILKATGNMSSVLKSKALQSFKEG